MEDTQRHQATVFHCIPYPQAINLHLRNTTHSFPPRYQYHSDTCSIHDPRNSPPVPSAFFPLSAARLAKLSRMPAVHYICKTYVHISTPLSPYLKLNDVSQGLVRGNVMPRLHCAVMIYWPIGGRIAITSPPGCNYRR